MGRMNVEMESKASMELLTKRFDDLKLDHSNLIALNKNLKHKLAEVEKEN